MNIQLHEFPDILHTLNFRNKQFPLRNVPLLHSGTS